MAYPIRMKAEPIREIAAASITSTFIAVGGPTSHPGRMVRFVNDTNQDVYVSLNGIDNHFRLPKASFLLFDISTNKTVKDNFFIQDGQVFYVAYIGITAPTTGDFWIEFVVGA